MKTLSPKSRELMEQVILLTKEKDLLDLDYYASDLAATRYHQIEKQIKELKKEMTE